VGATGVRRETVPQLVQPEELLDGEYRPDRLVGAGTGAVLHAVDEAGSDSVNQVVGKPRRDDLAAQRNGVSRGDCHG